MRSFHRRSLGLTVRRQPWISLGLCKSQGSSFEPRSCGSNDRSYPWDLGKIKSPYMAHEESGNAPMTFMWQQRVVLSLGSGGVLGIESTRMRHKESNNTLDACVAVMGGLIPGIWGSVGKFECRSPLLVGHPEPISGVTSQDQMLEIKGNLIGYN